MLNKLEKILYTIITNTKQREDIHIYVIYGRDTVLYPNISTCIEVNRYIFSSPKRSTVRPNSISQQV